MSYHDDERVRLDKERRLADALVTVGATLMDKAYPEWRQVVNPTYLDMRDGCNCVWGQIGGDYLDVVAWLDPGCIQTYRTTTNRDHRFVGNGDSAGPRWMRDHGFIDTDEVSYDALTQRWQEELGMEP